MTTPWRTERRIPFVEVDGHRKSEDLAGEFFSWIPPNLLFLLSPDHPP